MDLRGREGCVRGEGGVGWVAQVRIGASIIKSRTEKMTKVYSIER
jgi:hypothetical protein